jgi:hypothetical protein
MVLGSDIPGAVCPDCGHNDMAHGGYHHRDDSELDHCLICELKNLIKGYNDWLQDRMNP